MEHEKSILSRCTIAFAICLALSCAAACSKRTEPPPADGTALPSTQPVPPVEPAPPAEPAPSVEPGPSGQGPATAPDPATLATCDDVRAAYGRLVSNTSCSEDADCQILGGHCDSGLGGCFHAVNKSVTQAQLGALAHRWAALNCLAGVCRCAGNGPAKCEAGICVEVSQP